MTLVVGLVLVTVPDTTCCCLIVVWGVMWRESTWWTAFPSAAAAPYPRDPASSSRSATAQPTSAIISRANRRTCGGKAVDRSCQITTPASCSPSASLCSSSGCLRYFKARLWQLNLRLKIYSDTDTTRSATYIRKTVGCWGCWVGKSYPTLRKVMLSFFAPN